MFLRITIPTIVLTTLILVLSCKTQPDLRSSKFNEHINKNMCPDEGKCSLSVTPNQSIIFKKDEFGMGYAEFTKSDAILLKFEYQRYEIPNTVDGHYIERVYFELPRNPKTVFLENQDLEKAKLLFERVCFCKGQTGFYKIHQGALSIKPLPNNRYHLLLSFKTSEVPQIITEIDEIFSLK